MTKKGLADPNQDNLFRVYRFMIPTSIETKLAADNHVIER